VAEGSCPTVASGANCSVHGGRGAGRAISPKPPQGHLRPYEQIFEIIFGSGISVRKKTNYSFFLGLISPSKNF
jgi:hypothetical protein